MITKLEAYINETTNDFFGVVGSLEGALDASEIADQTLISDWYDFWTPLEIYRAVHGNNIDRTAVLEDLEKMKAFLERVLQEIKILECI